jgi:Zn-dependent peptidase ImmA (M78 family)/transcriptional regulator with XRE-family HTH domain
MERPVNPSMIMLARELEQWTQSELAKRLSISQGKLSKIEAGILLVADDLLTKLARVFNRPESFFRQPEVLHGMATSILYHRKRESAPARKMRHLDAGVNLRRIHVSRLLSGADIESDKTFPVLDIDEFDGRPDKVAQALRAAWAVPRGPVENLIELIEGAGGIVIRFGFGTRLIDAVSQRLPGLPPMFFLNSEMPADRERMSLAHELGHVVMHRVLNLDIEEQANVFASHFLMPDDDIRHSFSVVTLARLAALKPHWKVSMGALLMKAKSLGKVTGNQYEYMWKQMSIAGYRTREPEDLDLPAEKPRLLPELIEFHRTQLGYNPGQLAQLLHSSDQEIRSMYLGQYLKAV